MLISHDKRFLFIHIPKTAGTSITNSLAPYADRPQLLWENRLLASVGIHVNHIGLGSDGGFGATAVRTTFTVICLWKCTGSCSNSHSCVIRGIY